MKYRMHVSAAAIGLAAVGVLAAGCGGSGSSGTASSGDAGGNGGGGNNAFQAYVSCLQQNGVTMTMPSGRPGGMGGPGARPSGMPGAMPTGVRPSGGPQGGMPGGGGGFFQKPSGVSQATWDKAQTACASLRPSMGPGGGRGNGASLAYRNCLSNHGVTASAGPLNTADPKVAAAEKACAVLRPTTAPSGS